jgi:hypothetical protein
MCLLFVATPPFTVLILKVFFNYFHFLEKAIL